MIKDYECDPMGYSKNGNEMEIWGKKYPRRNLESNQKPLRRKRKMGHRDQRRAKNQGERDRIKNSKRPKGKKREQKDMRKRQK